MVELENKQVDFQQKIIYHHEQDFV